MAERRQVVLCPGVDGVLGEDGLYLHPTDGREALTIGEPHGSILGALLATAQVDLADHGGAILELLQSLLDHGYLRAREEVAADDVARWDRQIRYFAHDGRSGPAAQRLLRRSSVTIFGIGGVGGATTEALARMGVGTISMVDHDHVALANIPRQPLFDERMVGRSKVAAGAERLVQVDHTINVRTREEQVADSTHAQRLLVELAPDFVVIAADDPPERTQLAIAAACEALGTPSMIAGHRPPRIRIGPLLAPGTTACLACHSRARGVDAARTRIATDIPGILPGDQIAASWMAFAIVSWLTGDGPSAFLDRAMDLDMRTGATSWGDPPRQRCSRCSDSDALAA